MRLIFFLFPPSTIASLPNTGMHHSTFLFFDEFTKMNFLFRSSDHFIFFFLIWFYVFFNFIFLSPPVSTTKKTIRVLMPMNMRMYLIRSLFDCLSLVRGRFHWTQQNKRKLYFIPVPIVIISTVSVVGKYCKSQCFVSLNFLSIFSFSLSHNISPFLYTGETRQLFLRTLRVIFILAFVAFNHSSICFSFLAFI